MNSILYGRPIAPFVAGIIQDICAAARRMGEEIEPIAIEDAVRTPAHCARIERLYALPFDLPAAESGRPASLVRKLFPHADLVNPMDVHELCWDKLTTMERLLGRGIPVPESIFSNTADEVREFVRQHGEVILKERRSCGGQGHVVLIDTDEVLVGEAGGRRFVVELGDDAEEPRRLREGVLRYPPPFYVQRLLGVSGPRGAVLPGQVLRAYIVEGQVEFWTERYRERYLRPSDWIVNVGLGAKYRFVLETSEELRKIALRTADVLNVRIGAIDMIRTASGPYVLEADTDGCHMYIDRGFKQIPEFRNPFDFDRMIAASIVTKPEAAWAPPRKEEDRGP